MAQPTLAPFDFGEYVEFCGFLADQPIFALADGQLRLFTDHGEERIEANDGLTSAALTVDKKHLVTGGEDGRVVSVNAQGKTEEVATVERKWINTVATGPNGAIGWSAGRDVWAQQGSSVRQFNHERTAEHMAFAPKGLRVAVARYNGADLHWAGSEAESQSLEWAGPHHMVRFSPDGRFLVTAMQENALHGWRLTDARHMRMSGYPTKVKSFDFSSFTPKGGKWLATAGANSAVIWPFTGNEGPMGKMPKELGQRGDSLVTCVACHPKESVVAIGYADGMVALIAIENEKDAVLRRPGRGAVTTIGWHDSGMQLVFGTEDGAGGLVDLAG